jgi:hypothetical protein
MFNQQPFCGDRGAIPAKRLQVSSIWSIPIPRLA